MAFRDGITQVERRLESVEMNVLVWGSGKGSQRDYQKREKIRQALKLFFRYGDIRFSEDPEIKDIVPGANDLSIPQQELWHLHACDVCVVLDTSKGSGEEIAHFTGSSAAHKLLIFTHEKYKEASSFPASLRENQNQLFYSSEEYDSCSMVERVLDRVKLVALTKLMNLPI